MSASIESGNVKNLSKSNDYVVAVSMIIVFFFFFFRREGEKNRISQEIRFL